MSIGLLRGRADSVLLTGFQHKMLHISDDRPTSVDVEIDFQGNGSWHAYERIKVPAAGYAKHIFEDAFSAHWVRLTPDANCKATASFFFV